MKAAAILFGVAHIFVHRQVMAIKAKGVKARRQAANTKEQRFAPLAYH